MPQVGRHFNEYLNFLKQNGVSVRYDHVLPHALKSSQSDFNPEQVKSLLDKDKLDPNKHIVVSGDNHIVDGHHTWLANLWHPERSQKPLKVIKTNNNILDLIALSKRFPKVYYRDITPILKELYKHERKTQALL